LRKSFWGYQEVPGNNYKYRKTREILEKSWLDSNFLRNTAFFHTATVTATNSRSQRNADNQRHASRIIGKEHHQGAPTNGNARIKLSDCGERASGHLSLIIRVREGKHHTGCSPIVFFQRNLRKTVLLQRRFLAGNP
jgi:hypothetical protein